MSRNYLILIIFLLLSTVPLKASENNGMVKSPVKSYTKTQENEKKQTLPDPGIVRVKPESAAARSVGETYYYVVKNYRASYLAETVSLMLSSGGMIQANDDLNIIIVTDLSDRIDAIEEMLKEVDVLPQQVIIQARVLQVNDTLAKDNGMNVGRALEYASVGESISRTLTNGKSYSSIDYNNYQEDVDYGDVDEFIQASDQDGKDFSDSIRKVSQVNLSTGLSRFVNFLITNGYAKIVAEPKIVTINNKKGKVFIGDRVKIVKDFNNLGGNVTMGEHEGYMQEEAGLVLEVTPHIADGNYVTLDIRTGFGDINNYNDSSVSSTIKEAESSVIVKSGEPIVIGGYKSQDKTTTKYTVPLLGQVPILRKLFSKKETTVNDIEMIIILIPEIVKPGVGFKDETGAIENGE